MLYKGYNLIGNILINDIDDAEKVTSEPHDTHTLQIAPAQ